MESSSNSYKTYLQRFYSNKRALIYILLKSMIIVNRSHPCEFVEVPNIHVRIQKNLGGGAFFFRCFLVRGMSKASEKPWFEDFDW